MRLGVGLTGKKSFKWSIIAGATMFASEHPEVSITESPGTRDDHCDAQICYLPKEHFDGPQVCVSSAAKGSYPTVRTNEELVVDLIVKEFIALGMDHVAFFGNSESALDQTRFDVLCSRLSKQGAVPVFIDETMVEKAIAEVPRPCGVMAANDERGIVLLNECERLGISIPGELNVISVDNTPPCMDARPTLSSVEMPFHWIGYRAAEMCMKLHRGEETPEHVRIDPVGVVLRGSVLGPTHGLDAAVAAAHYVRTHFSEPIVMEDIMRQLHVSRRHLEKAFRKAYDYSPMSYLRHIRLERAKEMLHESDESLNHIAAKCGYPDANRLCRAFRSEIGTTPGRYRQGP